MIVFSPLRTRRLTVQLEELTIGQAIALCKIPPSHHEAGIAALLAAVARPGDKLLPGEVTDPRLWTVQERAFVVAHYRAHLGDEGPDFRIGETGKLSDYLQPEVDAPPERASLGNIAGDHWHLHPLLGAHAEAIERLVLTERLPAARHGWWVGAMAAQLVSASAEPLDVDSCSPAQLDEQIRQRAEIFLAFPESDFMDLLLAFLGGQDELAHLFRLEFDDDGLVFMPKAEVPGLPPARFPFADAIGARAWAVFGSTD